MVKKFIINRDYLLIVFVVFLKVLILGSIFYVHRGRNGRISSPGSSTHEIPISISEAPSVIHELDQD